MGVSERVSHGVSPRPPDTLGTLSGHFFNTPEQGLEGLAVGHSLGHPDFWEHPVGHSPGHFEPEGPERLFWLVGASPRLE